MHAHASLISAITRWMRSIVRRLNITSRATGSCFKALSLTEGKVFVAHVRVVAILIQRRIDGSTQLSWPIVVWDSWGWRLLIIPFCVSAA